MMPLLFARAAKNHRGAAVNPLLKCHLAFDGATGSTTITDTGSSPKVWARSGSAALSTAQIKWGSASLFVNSGYVSSTAALALGTGDFTLEGWYYCTNNTSTRGLFATAMVNGANELSVGADPSNGHVQMYLTGAVYNANYTFTNNAWTHVAVVRSGTSVALYIGGNLIMTNTIASGFNFSEVNWTVGAYYNSGFPWVGYIDDFGYTASAKYSGASFTPPTAALA
jgi:hypothetical protein